MSNNNSALIRGIVKKANFQFPAVKAGHWAANQNGGMGLGPKVNELIYRFIHSSKYVYRLGGLSLPVYEVTPQTTEALCGRAILIAEQFMRQNPEKKGRDFVLMDGTPWADIRASELFGYDILYICVFWKQDKPIIACVTGPRKWLKTSTFASLIVESSMQVTIVEYDENDEDHVQLHKLRNAIFSQTNFKLLKDFGTPIVKAVEATTDPENEYPVAAANCVDGVVWYVDRPHRHHHILQSQEYQDMLAAGGFKKDRTEGVVQGFLTNHGNFVTRYRAMLMAIENRMIVDTPEMAVQLTRHEQKAFQPEESQMGGILRSDDTSWGSFRVAVVPLFSEDLF